MKGNIIRKLFVAVVIIAPLFSFSDCKKQAKCGCNGDALGTYTDIQATVYFNETGTNIYFMPVGDPYSTFNFCNPSEMFKKMTEFKSGDILLVSGSYYWECNYLYQTSQGGQYQSYYKVYMINVTNVRVSAFGKK
jgi:hypothetical protein